MTFMSENAGKDFDLSSKKRKTFPTSKFNIYLEDDVKEFIRLLKEKCCNNTQCCCDEIDELAGEELI